MVTVPDKVTISVHERLDEPGFIVRVTVGEGPDWQRVAKFPVDDRAEADALAQSIRGYVEAGLPVDALIGDDSEEHVAVSDGCPRCGCRDVDDFTWEGQGVEVMCDRCGCCYAPCSSSLAEEG